MVRRATLHLLEWTAAGLAVLLILFGCLAWMIASGPIGLGFLKPNLAGMLTRALDAESVDFESAQVDWADEGRALRLKVREARIFAAPDTVAVTVPELELGFSVAALTRGMIAPTRIIFTGASARVVRRADGQFALGLIGEGETPVPEGLSLIEPPDGSGSALDEGAASQSGQTASAGPAAPSAAGAEDLAARLARQLIGARDPASALGYLEEIVIGDARLSLLDASSGSVVAARDADLTLRRGDPGIDLALDAALDIGGRAVTLSMTGNRPGLESGTRFALSFTDFDWAVLADYVPALKRFAAYRGPVRGKVGLDLSAEGAISRLDLDLVAGPGRIPLTKPESLPMVESDFQAMMIDRVPEAVPLRSLGLSAALDVPTGAVTVRGLTLRTDEADIRLTGTGALRLGTEGEDLIQGIGFDVAGEALKVHVPVYSEEVADLDRFELAGEYDLGASRLTLDRLFIGAYGGTFDFSGSVATVGGKPEIFLTGAVETFPGTRLLKLWPLGPAMGARDWIGANVKAGTITRGDLSIEAPAGTLDVGYMPDEAMTVTFTVEDMITHFVPGLPPMTNVTAEGTLLGDTFIAKIVGAEIDRIKVREGQMKARPLHVRGATGVFDAAFDGPLSDVLALLDMGPFGYPSRYGIDTAAVGGQGSMRLNIALPMRRNLEIGQIEFAGAANIADLSLDGIFAGRDLADGDLTLKINGEGLLGEGTARVADLPARLVWKEDFTGAQDFPTEFRLGASLGNETRAGFGLDDGGLIDGPVAIEVIARGRGADLRAVTAEADLRDAGLSLPGTGWSKPIGQPADAKLALSLSETGAFALESMSLAAPGVDVTGSFALGPDGQLLGANFPRIRLAETADLSFRASRGTDDALEVSVAGAYLDAAPLLDGLFGADAGGMDGAAGADTPTINRPFRLNAQLERLGLRAGVTVLDPSVTIAARDGVLEDLMVQGSVAGTGTLNVDLARTAPDTRALKVSATDAGSIVRGVLGEDSVEGGRLQLAVDLVETGGPDDPVDIKGRLGVDKFRVMNVPLLARLLTVGSFVGLSDLLQGEGIWFDRLDVPFESVGTTWALEEGRAYGPSVGLTVTGGFDPDMAATDLHGTIVPAYSVNSVLGKVPVIGDLFVSKEGEGIFGITYRIVGSEEGSNIYVNPLSALAPGFLRRLFEIGMDDDMAQDDPLDPPAPPTPPAPGP